MSRTAFERMTKGRQIARICGVIREVWEHDSAHGPEASRIVDPYEPATAWIETSNPDHDLVPVRSPDNSDFPDGDAADGDGP